MSLSGESPTTGMTRLEVAVALVVATVIVIGASIIFKAVERSAGNARAMDKLLAFRQVVEEYVSTGLGYPTVPQIRTVWSRARARDCNRSPWGGLVGHELAEASISAGVGGVPFIDMPVRQGGALGRAGAIGYMLSRDPARTVALYDVTNNTTANVRFYGCFIYDPAGTFPHFSTGGQVR